jgi:hypothetical protein
MRDNANEILDPVDKSGPYQSPFLIRVQVRVFKRW